MGVTRVVSPYRFLYRTIFCKFYHGEQEKNIFKLKVTIYLPSIFV